PAKVESFGTVLFVCNKLGSATALPIMKALKQANNRVLALLSAEREEKILMLEDIRKQVDVVLNVGADYQEVTDSLETIFKQ
ncbi:hypothetical protein QP572_14160, partial [Brevibacterium sp. UMB10442]|nr:hypothetical protein [Brevibacterium sp. UMB10442]